MGGDLGPRVQVEGVVDAVKNHGLKAILVGSESDLRSIVKGLGSDQPPADNLTIVNAPDVIEMDDAPARGVMKKPDSSLCVAYRLVEEGKASAVLSSGNSGAMMAAGMIYGGLLPGIKRPAIATLIPVAEESRPNCLIDAGANVECQAHNLVQFAIMGSIYSAALFDGGPGAIPAGQAGNGSLKSVPRVGLLSNGSESGKGTEVVRSAALQLAEVSRGAPELFEYVGYIEGRDVARRKADVIVCDGFVGNIVLKAMEGCVRLINDELLHESKKSLISRVAVLLSGRLFQNVFSHRFDYTSYGGAPLLGLRRLAIVLHGASDARAVKNAVCHAQVFVERQMTERIASELAKLEALAIGSLDDVFSGMLPPNRRRTQDEDIA